MRGTNNEYIPLLTTDRGRYYRTMYLQFCAHFKHNLLYHAEKNSNIKMQKEIIHNLRSFDAMTQNILYVTYLLIDRTNSYVVVMQ